MKYKDLNDYYLIDMVCEGDDISYGVLFDKYRPLIRNIAAKFYKKYKDYGYDFEDFVQEGYIGFYKALKYFNIDKEVLLYSFVSLCVTRQLISFVNKISAHPSYVLFSNNDYDFDVLFSVGFDFEEKYDINNIVKDVIYDSPLDYSSVFELKINDFTYSEIQDLLGLTFSQAEYRYRKMRLLLKDKLVKYLNKKAE